MTKKFLGVFDTRPLIWFHYVLLAIAIFVIHELTNIVGLESAAVMNGGVYWLGLLGFYALFIGIADQIIHKVLGVD